MLRIAIDGKGRVLNSNFIWKPLKLEVSKALLLLDELENDGMLSRLPSSKEHSFRKNDTFEIKPKGEVFLLNKGGFIKRHNESVKNNSEKDRIVKMESERKQLEFEVLKLQKSELKNKRRFSFLGFVAGSIVTIGIGLLPHIMSDTEKAEQNHPAKQTANDNTHSEMQPSTSIDTTETP